MKAPLKLNRAGWPHCMARFTVADPRVMIRADLTAEEFSRHLSVLKFGTTFKTTRPGRHARSNRLLAALYRGDRPIILDVGASDGSTCLDLMLALEDRFARYFATDYHLSVEWGTDSGGVVFFRDSGGRCVLRAGRRFVAYCDTKGARPPLGLVATLLLRGVRRVSSWRELSLIQPSLLARAARDPRVVVERYDLFTPWRGPRPDLIKIANLLNRIYFSEQRIAAVLARQREILREGGRLLLLDNRGEEEKFSLLRKLDGKMTVEHSFGGGSEVVSLA
jgi:hypothetical protein